MNWLWNGLREMFVKLGTREKGCKIKMKGADTPGELWVIDIWINN